MSVGPLLAGILDIATGRDVNVDIELPFSPAGGIIFNHVTSPGYLMASLWLLQLVALVFVFREPNRINGLESDSLASKLGGPSGDGACGDGTALLDQNDSGGYGSLSAEMRQLNEGKRGPGLFEELTITAKLVFQNPGLPLTVLLFGYIEMVDEVLISSCSMVCRRYFGWHASVAGFLIASLGALVLPAHFVVEKASHYYSERRIMLVRAARGVADRMSGTREQCLTFCFLACPEITGISNN